MSAELQVGATAGAVVLAEVGRGGRVGYTRRLSPAEAHDLGTRLRRAAEEAQALARSAADGKEMAR